MFRGRKRRHFKHRLGIKHRRHPLAGGQLCLADLEEGDRAKVVEIYGSEHFRIRLMEMGLLPGDLVEIDKYAPLQDPIEIIVKGYHLALRVHDAGKIVVKKLKDE